MELYMNSNWTERYMNTYIVEAVAYSEHGNHATIYTVGITAEEVDGKLIEALHELKVIPELSRFRRAVEKDWSPYRAVSKSSFIRYYLKQSYGRVHIYP